MRKVTYSNQFEILLNNMTTNSYSHLPESVKNMQEAATHYIMKSTETNSLSNACHAIASQLFSKGKMYFDLENTKIEQHTNKKVNPLNGYHDKLAISFFSKTQQVLISMDLKYSKPDCVFDAWYFKFRKFHCDLSTIRCSDIYQKDLICSVFLQHPSKKNYYYYVQID